MTLNQLKYIVELSKDSSINEAAKNCSFRSRA